jgi:RecA-family ATPase
LATRTQWLGFPTTQGPFLYLGAEDDDAEIHRRLDSIRMEMGQPWGEFADFHFKSLAGEDAILATYDRTSQKVVGTALLNEFEKRIEEIGAVGCAIDTSSDVFGGQELDRAQVRQFIGLLRGICKRQRCFIVLLAHPSVAGMASGTGISGSTAWNNSVRSRLYLEAVDDDPDARTLKFMKSNYGPKGEPMGLRWQRGLFVPCVSKRRKASKTPEEAEAVFLTMLDKYNEQDRHVSHKPSSSYAPKVFDADESCPCTKEALRNAMNRLLNRKEIKVETYGPPSKHHQRLVRA